MACTNILDRLMERAEALAEGPSDIDDQLPRLRRQRAGSGSRSPARSCARISIQEPLRSDATVRASYPPRFDDQISGPPSKAPSPPVAWSLTREAQAYLRYVLRHQGPEALVAEALRRRSASEWAAAEQCLVLTDLHLNMNQASDITPTETFSP